MANNNTGRVVGLYELVYAAECGDIDRCTQLFRVYDYSEHMYLKKDAFLVAVKNDKKAIIEFLKNYVPKSFIKKHT